ncbi:hypothetical protein DL96DRAFT_1622802 [Flagelloscypha sp. PMI_526]|nr:hypothetical protein DL96DRAFT_1622802 [Flagelloscypha sp. PMI_526]
MSDLLKKNLGARLLSLDGGRWETLSPISQIHILEDILSYYEFDNGLEPGTFKVCDAFDLVVGTGTGGLIAFMFSVLKMSIQEAKDAYLRLYHSAFAPETASREERADLLRRALEHLLETGAENFDGRLSETRLRDIEKFSRGCKCAVTAMSTINTAHPLVFRAYRGRNTSLNCFPLEALLATLADVEAFPAVKIDDEKFISTNLGYFNSSEELLKEASSILPLDSSISTIVSIGPGCPPPISVNGLEEFLQGALDHAKDCQAVSDRIKTRFSRHSDFYMRFEVDSLDLKKQDLETGASICSAVTSHSRAYLSRDETCRRIGILRRSLTDRPRRLKVSQLSGLDGGAMERIEEEVKEGILLTVLNQLEISHNAPYNSAAARLHTRAPNVHP